MKSSENQSKGSQNGRSRKKKKRRRKRKKDKKKKTKKESSRRIWDLRQRERNGEVRGRGEKAGSNKIP